ncbi:MAG: TetR/AcrR family transcriptional regulator [Firmicutes bacterium]|jgi:AcrR family transcriptional regulator|nr:TetR/AcrR family transcriptional regulator [Bacillota bacterium]
MLRSTSVVYSCPREGGVAVTGAFSRLDPAKQKRILDAAMAEFARYGYEQASTNRIVQAAGIGKGMLFHYFKSKLDLFRYLVDYSLRYVRERYMVQVDWREPDFIKRLSGAARIKMEAAVHDPHMFNFLSLVYLNEMNRLTPGQRKAIEAFQADVWGAIYENIDTSLFRPDVPPGQVINVLRWTITGYQQELIARLQQEDVGSVDLKAYFDEYYELLAVLRRIFYKEEADSGGSSGNS